MKNWPKSWPRISGFQTVPLPADALDVGPVRDVALRLVEKIKAEHIERPYATP